MRTRRRANKAAQPLRTCIGSLQHPIARCGAAALGRTQTRAEEKDGFGAARGKSQSLDYPELVCDSIVLHRGGQKLRSCMGLHVAHRVVEVLEVQVGAVVDLHARVPKHLQSASVSSAAAAPQPGRGRRTCTTSVTGAHAARAPWLVHVRFVVESGAAHAEHDVDRARRIALLLVHGACAA